MARLIVLDKWISQRTLALRGTPWDWAATLGAHLGDSFIWIAAGIALLIWGTFGVRVTTWLMVLGNGFGLTAAGIVKGFTHRERPFERPWFYLPPDRYSFPSGHSVRMGAIAVVVAARHPPLALLVAACGALVGVHYPGRLAARPGWGRAVPARCALGLPLGSSRPTRYLLGGPTYGRASRF
jgi:undecaprenyl-diphosphatase